VKERLVQSAGVRNSESSVVKYSETQSIRPTQIDLGYGCELGPALDVRPYRPWPDLGQSFTSTVLLPGGP
jgi:hypothetical protein